jgi:hypothetical protein
VDFITAVAATSCVRRQQSATGGIDAVHLDAVMGVVFRVALTETAIRLSWFYLALAVVAYVCRH